MYESYLLDTKLELLSAREARVVVLASQGYTDRDICHVLGIAPGTLGTYWSRIRVKTGIPNRTSIAASYSRREAAKRLRQVLNALVATMGWPTDDRALGVFTGLDFPAFLFEPASGQAFVTDGLVELYGCPLRGIDCLSLVLGPAGMALVQDAGNQLPLEHERRRFVSEVTTKEGVCPAVVELGLSHDGQVWVGLLWVGAPTRAAVLI